jgi:hypothetical protein
MRKYAPILVGIVVLGAAASPALANAGTPLMMGTLFQLVIGNTLIAVVEGWLIHRFFRPNRRPWETFKIMLLANFSSMLVGAAVMDMVGHFVIGALGAEALYLLPTILVTLFVGSYAATLILEWPFCLWAVGTRPKRLKDSVKAVLLTQTVSYLMTVPLLLVASTMSLVTRTKVDRQFVPNAPNIATVYFLSEDERSLLHVRLNGSALTGVMAVPPPVRPDVITSIYLSRQKGQKWDLMLEQATRPQQYKKTTLLLPGVADLGGLAWGAESGDEGVQGMSPFSWGGNAAGLQSEERRDWWIESRPMDHPYAFEGVRAVNRRTGENVSVALETPFVRWRAGNTSLLPGDLLVFQLDRQIMLLDLHTKRIGRIAMGLNPVVILDEEVAAKAVAQQSATSPTTTRGTN